MPTRPKGQRRPADVIGNAIKIARIATGEIEDALPTTARTQPRKPWEEGRAPRAKAMSPERRAEIAKAATTKRWNKITASD